MLLKKPQLRPEIEGVAFQDPLVMDLANANAPNQLSSDSLAARVLVLSRNYPNNVMELLGLWVQGLVRESARFCQIKVVSPVPYSPPIPGLPEEYSRFRRVARNRWDGQIEILHPRFLVGP